MKGYMNKPGFCAHGWTEAYLRAHLIKEQAKLNECEETHHPFGKAMTEAQRKIVENLKAHIAELPEVPA